MYCVMRVSAPSLMSTDVMIQSFSFTTCPISQLCTQICIAWGCFNRNYTIFNMTLHAELANPTCLQSFRFGYCSVCELCCLNQRRRRILVLMVFPYNNIIKVSGVF